MPEIHHCNFKVMFASAENVKEKTFRQIVIDQCLLLHQSTRICAFVVDV